MDIVREYLDRLTELRQEIDQIDQQILYFLNRRAETVLAIRALKAGQDMPLFAPWREEEILGRLKSLNPGLFYDQAIEEIFRVILKESLALMQREDGGVA